MRYRVKVHPKSRSEGVVRNADGSLKVHLRVPPVQGRANKALVDILAEHFEVSRSGIKIVKGGKSRDKVVEIT